MCRRAAYNACILYPHYPALLSSGPPRHCRRHIKSWQLTCESSPTEATGRKALSTVALIHSTAEISVNSFASAIVS